jgi:STE24 endopeptidase
VFSADPLRRRSKLTRQLAFVRHHPRIGRRKILHQALPDDRMYFTVILAFALILGDDLPPRGLVAPLFRPTPAVLSWVVGQVLLIAIVALLGRRWTRQAIQAGRINRALAIDTRTSQMSVCLITLFLAFSMICTPWATLVRSQWALSRWPLVGDLVLLAPYFLSLAVMWAIRHRSEVGLRSCLARTESAGLPAGSPPAPDLADHEASLGTYLLDKFRHHVLVIAAPMILIVFVKYFTETYRQPLARATTLPWISDALLGLASCIVLLFSPMLLSVIWSTEPLPAGQLRERFARTCRRIGLKYREILLWRTHGTAVNAAVMGFIAPLRYILVSDALLEQMDEDEVEAVFSHEAGHVHHWHLPLFGIFALVSIYIAGGAFLLVGGRITDPGLLQVGALGVLTLIWLFGFGWLSRKFERQADLFAVISAGQYRSNCTDYCPVHGSLPREGVCVSAANLFGRTLSKIADLNGISRTAPSWRHGTIESRCRLMEQFTHDGRAMRSFQSSLKRIKIFLLTLGAIGTAATVWIYSGEVLRALRFMGS